jgi:hypothetical protein
MISTFRQAKQGWFPSRYGDGQIRRWADKKIPGTASFPKRRCPTLRFEDDFIKSMIYDFPGAGKINLVATSSPAERPDKISVFSSPRMPVFNQTFSTFFGPMTL